MEADQHGEGDRRLRISADVLAAFTGVRRNEALAFRFDDIEWFTNEANVRHAISKRRRKDGGQKWEWHVGPPKSRKSVRRIAATESVMKMLAELKVGKPGTAFLFPGNCSGSSIPTCSMLRSGSRSPRRRGCPELASTTSGTSLRHS